MKKLILFLLLLVLVKNADAIALMPPVLEFNDGEEKNFMVFNTNDFDSRFIVEADDGFVISNKEFVLGPKERITLTAAADDVKSNEGIIYIKELIDDKNGLRLENGVGLKYKVNDNTEHKLDSINGITGNAIKFLGKEESNSVKTISIALLGIAIILAIFYSKEKARKIKDKLENYWFYYKINKNLK